MRVHVAKWDAATAASRLRNRRRWRLAAAGVCGLIVLSSLADHFKAKNRGDDWLRFDGRPVAFVSAIDGESIAVRDDAGDITPVRLLGVASFNADWDQRSTRRLDAMLGRHKLTLLLESTQTRDSQGRLLAYVFMDDARALSPAMVGQGLALDDRRVPFAFHGAVDQAESLARRKHIGLWATATLQNMPAWREAWFQQRANLASDAF
ncbi:MAG TPA: thermonuclease family protein [Tepidisphaeraceae bacterium]